MISSPSCDNIQAILTPKDSGKEKSKFDTDKAFTEISVKANQIKVELFRKGKVLAFSELRMLKNEGIDITYIQNLQEGYVKGIGTTMLLEIEKIALEMGFKYITLSDITEGKFNYAKRGYSEISRAYDQDGSLTVERKKILRS